MHKMAEQFKCLKKKTVFLRVYEVVSYFSPRLTVSHHFKHEHLGAYADAVREHILTKLMRSIFNTA